MGEACVHMWRLVGIGFDHQAGKAGNLVSDYECELCGETGQWPSNSPDLPTTH